MHNKIKAMFELQNTLNNNTNGVKWHEGTTKEGRAINWNRCIFMEVAEAIESIGSWKHWKDLNAKTDYENIKIELTDIFHFLLSKQIEVFNGNMENAVNDFLLRYDAIKNNASTLPLLESLETIA